MGLITGDYYQAPLAARMDVWDTDLPLEQAPYVGLMDYLPTDGDYVYMSIRSPVSFETVKVRRVGTGLYVERGLAGTKAATHPYGAVVSTPNPTVIAVLRDLTEK